MTRNKSGFLNLEVSRGWEDMWHNENRVEIGVFFKKCVENRDQLGVPFYIHSLGYYSYPPRLQNCDKDRD